MWIRDSRKSGFNVTTQLSESWRQLTSGTGELVEIEEPSDTTMIVTHFTLTVSAVICFKVLFISHFIYTVSVQAYSILWRQLLSWAFLSPSPHHFLCHRFDRSDRSLLTLGQEEEICFSWFIVPRFDAHRPSRFSQWLGYTEIVCTYHVTLCVCYVRCLATNRSDVCG